MTSPVSDDLIGSLVGGLHLKLMAGSVVLRFFLLFSVLFQYDLPKLTKKIALVQSTIFMCLESEPKHNY